ncbi:4Fe-4S ferredoxin iron-sulfur binding domain protein [uncultured Desulfobacterium sp.]|uniref:4Fe-4S ferredoxin iron-sulfur binding domain protein n=1 Tax=uncultured Desulfobacterium sp. TaxID=201089 RepID=A0A445N2U3_9BACT|nr:4Fe-4S ferredoxin iron-sulfur binding domain protein [uncultured Desulfobacterium sp.]
MTQNPVKLADEVVIDRDDLQQILDVLESDGYQTIGPVIREGVMVYGELKTVFDLPVGWTDEQGPGSYRLKKSDTPTLFGYVVGAQSWKKYLYPSVSRLWRSEREGNGFSVIEEKDQFPAYAFFGARSCEISAISIQDRVFNNDKYSDYNYNEIRRKSFIVAVNCTKPAGTCFCASMDTGPKAFAGFDIALTELLTNKRHFFIAEAGSDRGASVLSRVTFRPVTKDDKALALGVHQAALRQMVRRLNTSNLAAIFSDHFDHPQWEKVSGRCLTCGNCTMVCPTCFCHTIEDKTALDGLYAERWRKWDSCFTKDFSYIHGGSIRASEKSRYRQWLTHKLVTWVEQFGTLGCVGCGRCITWCPVGIDITEEASVIMQAPDGVSPSI